MSKSVIKALVTAGVISAGMMVVGAGADVTDDFVAPDVSADSSVVEIDRSHDQYNSQSPVASNNREEIESDSFAPREVNLENNESKEASIDIEIKTLQGDEDDYDATVTYDEEQGTVKKSPHYTPFDGRDYTTDNDVGSGDDYTDNNDATVKVNTPDTGNLPPESTPAEEQEKEPIVEEPQEEPQEEVIDMPVFGDGEEEEPVAEEPTLSEEINPILSEVLFNIAYEYDAWITFDGVGANNLWADIPEEIRDQFMFETQIFADFNSFNEDENTYWGMYVGYRESATTETKSELNNKICEMIASIAMDYSDSMHIVLFDIYNSYNGGTLNYYNGFGKGKYMTKNGDVEDRADYSQYLNENFDYSVGDWQRDFLRDFADSNLYLFDTEAQAKNYATYMGYANESVIYGHYDTTFDVVYDDLNYYGGNEIADVDIWVATTSNYDNFRKEVYNFSYALNEEFIFEVGCEDDEFGLTLGEDYQFAYCHADLYGCKNGCFFYDILINPKESKPVVDTWTRINNVLAEYAKGKTDMYVGRLDVTREDAREFVANSLLITTIQWDGNNHDTNWMINWGFKNSLTAEQYKGYALEMMRIVNTILYEDNATRFATAYNHGYYNFPVEDDIWTTDISMYEKQEETKKTYSREIKERLNQKYAEEAKQIRGEDVAVDTDVAEDINDGFIEKPVKSDNDGYIPKEYDDGVDEEDTWQSGFVDGDDCSPEFVEDDNITVPKVKTTVNDGRTINTYTSTNEEVRPITTVDTVRLGHAWKTLGRATLWIGATPEEWTGSWVVVFNYSGNCGGCFEIGSFIIHIDCPNGFTLEDLENARELAHEYANNIDMDNFTIHGYIIANYKTSDAVSTDGVYYNCTRNADGIVKWVDKDEVPMTTATASANNEDDSLQPMFASNGSGEFWLSWTPNSFSDTMEIQEFLMQFE